MKGLIYKDLNILIRGTKPIYYLGVIVVVGWVFTIGGNFGGLFASVFLTYFGSILSSMVISFDEKARWRKYETTLPTGRRKSITSKYIVVLIFMIFCIMAAILFFFLNSVFAGSVNWTLLYLQIGIAIILPLVWNALFIPITYGIGYQGASYISMILIVPTVFLMKYFEDGPGIIPSISTVRLWGLLGLACAVIIFGISYLITTTIHNRKEYT